MIVPVLLSGGIGLRLWPLSTPDSPKQFLRIFGRESLLQLAAQRLMGMDEAQAPLVVTHESMRPQVINHLEEIGCLPAAILTEPVGRNTAPAAMAAALWADPDDLLLGLPTDHLVADTDGFLEAIRQGIPSARRGHPVIFGIRPSRPHPGLGYMETGAQIDNGVRRIRRFVEKPDLDTARRMVDSGNYLWNGGMFLAQAGVLRRLIEELLPEVAAAVREAYSASRLGSDGTMELGAAFGGAPAVSVAKGLWERAGQLWAVPMQAGWSDIGSWDALGEALGADERGNVVAGRGVVEAAQRVQVHAPSTQTAVIGVSDVVVVVANGRALVIAKDMWENTDETIKRLEGI